MGVTTLLRKILVRIIEGVKNPSYSLMRIKVSIFGMAVRKPTAISTDAHKRLFMSGYCFLPELPDNEVAEVKNNFFTNHDASESDYLASAKDQNLIRCPGLYSDGGVECPMARVARRKDMLQLASDYLGIPIKDLYFSANVDVSPLVSDVGERNPDGSDSAFRFHRDVDSYRFLKAFVYLSDVDSEGFGQHELFEGSALKWKMPWRLKFLKRYTLNEIQKNLPTAIHTPIYGKAGTFFAENTTGFHRGSHAIKSPRVMLSLAYGSKEYFNRYPKNVCKIVSPEFDE